MSLQISTRVNGAATVMDVAGRVTLENAPEFLKALMQVVKVQRPPRLLVNMTGVSYIDSAGAACLVEALKVSRDLKIAFALFGLGPVSKDVLELTRLNTVFEIYDTEDQALRGATSASFGTRS
ncbi:MAG TPA: STAS domain-containing protein [Candidatus Dormibacteraeota bacterium]|nr:STAS domain-containing protein [Candidatus Dormibacteraeota bacterium]